MYTAEINKKLQVNKKLEIESGYNLNRIIKLVLPKWYLVLISLVVAFFTAHVYISKSIPVYSVSASILINENRGNSSLNDQFLQGFGLPAAAQNIQNQIMILTSRGLVERVLEELPFQLEFYYRTFNNILPIYPEFPIEIVNLAGTGLPNDVEFEFIYVDSNNFILNTDSKAPFELHTQASFGDTIDIPGGSIQIDRGNTNFLSQKTDERFYFINHNKAKLVKNYIRRLKVEQISRDGTILLVNIAGTNRAKEVDFINMLTDVFISLSLDKKNLEAARRIQFIDDQLIGITDSLVLTENRLQQFRSRNKVMDLSAQGQAIIDQLVALENERARFAIETNYYNYLYEYLHRDINDEMPVAPATMGISDPGLMRLVAELAELQGQASNRSLGEMNPLQNQLIQRIKNTKEALLETLNGLRQANSISVEENNAQIRRLNNQAAALPGTERQLLGIERKFRLNDELYTFLLERRSELQMQKASNVPDNEVVDYGNVQDVKIISPNILQIQMLAFIIGVLLPLSLIFLFDFLDKTVKTDDIETRYSLPVAAKIPHNLLKTNTVVFESPDSVIAESFRMLRSKMQFFTKEIKSPVILLTSSLPEDGKTFVAINLASAYSLMGKKTILVGFDLRKPKIFADFNLGNETGLSTWLIGKDKLQDVIKPTAYENLFLISSGPVPPNPSELTALPKTEELIIFLRKNFDCIIIDSSPIGLVSDTYYIASLADSCLFVIRNEKTLKINLERTVNDMKISDIRSISLVINDLHLDNNHYGYSGKYGYTKNQGHNGNILGKVKLSSKILRFVKRESKKASTDV